MRIALGADHGGFALKQQILEHLRSQGHEVFDAGTDSEQSIDYPDYAEKVALRVTGGEADRGILVCTTGMGMCIAANKVAGIRAALAMNADEVQLTRAHNDANVLALGAKYTSVEAAEDMIGIFLTTPFQGGRHQRRVDKISHLEAERL